MNGTQGSARGGRAVIKIEKKKEKKKGGGKKERKSPCLLTKSLANPFCEQLVEVGRVPKCSPLYVTALMGLGGTWQRSECLFSASLILERFTHGSTAHSMGPAQCPQSSRNHSKAIAPQRPLLQRAEV